MEQNFQTSFIPKKPMLKEESPVYARPVNIFLIISLFALVTVLVATGGLYFYKGMVVKNIANLENTLNLAKNRFEPSKIVELQTLDKRLRASSEILSRHTTITPIFKALEQITMKSVRFTKFSYDLGTDKDNKTTVNVKMSGIAIGYRSIALQSDLFAKNKNLLDPVFSNLVLDNSGNVIFDLDFSVDPSFINYKQALMAQS
jgi:hypothetical protein